jgi:hypothetical protein
MQALHFSFIDGKIVNQARHRGQNCAHDSARDAICCNCLPYAITSCCVYHVADQRKGLQSVHVRDANGLFEAFGNTNDQALSISGDYSVLSGACAEDGTFSMTTP